MRRPRRFGGLTVAVLLLAPIGGGCGGKERRTSMGATAAAGNGGSAVTGGVNMPLGGPEQAIRDRIEALGAAPVEVPFEEIEVHDGDTISVPKSQYGSKFTWQPGGLTTDGARVRLRLAGIDAPDAPEYGAHDAEDRLRDLLSGQVVDIYQEGVDSKGRPLIHVITPNGRVISARMVREGWALTGWWLPHSDALNLAALQDQAASEAQGVWLAFVQSQNAPITAQQAAPGLSGVAAGQVRTVKMTVAAVSNSPGGNHVVYVNASLPYEGAFTVLMDPHLFNQVQGTISQGATILVTGFLELDQSGPFNRYEMWVTSAAQVSAAP